MTGWNRRSFLCQSAAATLGLRLRADPYAARPGDPVFLLEGSTVEDYWGLKRKLNPLVKSARNPIITKTGAWEGSGPYVYGSVLYDDRDKLYRCWYTVYHDHEYREKLYGSYLTCLATSADGYVWQKPELGLVEWRGSRKNNLVQLGRKYVGAITVVPAPPGTGLPGRFLAVYIDSPGVCLSYSDDGAVWREHPGNPVESHHSDAHNSIVYDPVRRKWLLHLRPPLYAGPWKRRVALMESDDLRTWTRPEVVLAPDEADVPEFYGMPVFRRGNLFFGLLQIFDQSEGRIEIELVFSADGRNWQRVPPREPFLKRGAADDFDRGMVLTASSPVIVGNEMRLYYGGTQVDHRQQTPDDVAVSAIGMGSISVDRFFGVTTLREKDPGFLLTRPLMLDGKGLALNASADGQILVALLDVEGRELPGFGFKDCLPVRGDHLRQPVSWRDKRFPEQNLLRVKLQLERAAVYAMYVD